MIEYLIIASAVATLLSTSAYIRSMFKGIAKPNRITWLMWAVAPLIAFAAAKSAGVGWAAVPVLIAGLSPFLVLMASFLTKKAYWKLSAIDYACGVLSALALSLWWATRDPSLAIIFAILSDGLATAPTFMKAWRFPQTESIWPYATGVFGSLVSLIAVTTWVFSGYGFPAYLLVANALVIVAITRKRAISVNFLLIF